MPEEQEDDMHDIEYEGAELNISFQNEFLAAKLSHTNGVKKASI